MPRLALTPGCPSGIGPELFPVALQKADLSPETLLIWCGGAAHFVKHATAQSIEVKRKGQDLSMRGKNGELRIHCLLDDARDPALLAHAGQPDENALAAQRDALLMAIEQAKLHRIDAVVTGPVRKAALANIDGQSFAGQTELFHHHLAADGHPPLMCFAGYRFILGLATIHVAIKDVSPLIDESKVTQQILRLQAACAQLLAIDPSGVRIAVLGLNPHAGEGGLIGDEEIKVITPVMETLRRRGLNLEGPLPADGFFGNLYRMTPDQMPHAVLAMMHDQGLAPYKLLCQGKVANATFGLTIARTSPAHGTGDDIAGRYVASPDSLVEAIELAARLAKNQRDL
jgi:4-hydroxythreonine-4-phosphate dehydrogenase